MKLLYFAWVRAGIGLCEEMVTPPAGVGTVADLLAWLQTRGPGYARVLANLSMIRVAVNQDLACLDHAVASGDEVALFPPVTGG